MESETKRVEGKSQVVRGKRGRPLTEELRRAYYQRMSPELQKQWDLLASEEQDAILEMVEEYHQSMEYELWRLLGGLIQVHVEGKNK